MLVGHCPFLLLLPFLKPSTALSNLSFIQSHILETLSKDFAKDFSAGTSNY